MSNYQINRINPSKSSSYSHFDNIDNHRTPLSIVPTLTSVASISFRVCQTYRNRADTKYIWVPRDSTLSTLKEEICQQRHLSIKPTDMTLTIFNQDEHLWTSVDETNVQKTIVDFKFPSYSILNIERDEETTRTNSFIKLRFCKQPMKKFDFIYLSFYPTDTIDQLKDKARKYITTNKTNYLYLWKDDKWIKLETDLNDITLAELDIVQDTIISFEPEIDFVPGVCGLTNLGNTCFMNSALQCLSNIPELTEKILSFGKEMNAPILGAYSSLIQTMWLNNCAVTTPSTLLLNIRESLPIFPRYKQRDTQEFMNYFLHLIHQELTNEKTLVTDLFYGQIRSSVKCLGGCNFIETTEENISFLPLPIEDNVNQYDILYLRSNGEQNFKSFQSSARTVSELKESFIQHYNLDLSIERIEADKIINNRIVEIYDSYILINDISKHQLVFIELPEKSVDQKYVEFRFLNRETRVSFRPPIYIVCPLYDCHYSDLSKQIEQIQRHLIVDGHISWTNNYSQSFLLKSELCKNDSLLFLRYIAIEMDSLSIEKYQKCNKFELRTDKSSLISLLIDFFHEEQLDGDYYCSKCLTLGKAKQKADLVLPLPRVLIIQLKRFTYEANSDKKIDTFIDFPLKDLDLSPYIIKNCDKKKSISALYDLVAVANHTGTLSAGHYITYAKNHRNQTWYSLNDEIVREIPNETDIITKNAYILVYIKRCGQ